MPLHHRATLPHEKLTDLLPHLTGKHDWHSARMHLYPTEHVRHLHGGRIGILAHFEQNARCGKDNETVHRPIYRPVMRRRFRRNHFEQGLAILSIFYTRLTHLRPAEVEPATEHKLFKLENVIATPHLGASTGEAQENVALQVAEQMSDYLINGAVTNALNMPSITADEAPRLKPFVALAEKLGSFAGQLTEDAIQGIVIEYAGDVGELNTKALTSAALAGVLQAQLGTVNMVSAPVVARERGIQVDQVKQSKRGAYETYIRVTVKTDMQERSVAGTVFSDGKPRIIQIKGIELECNFGSHMLYITNKDKPGFVGAVGTVLGNAKINMATFHLGRNIEGGDAICIVETDGGVPENVMEDVRKLANVQQVKALKF